MLEKVAAFLTNQSRWVTGRAVDNRLDVPKFADPLRGCVTKFIEVRPKCVNQLCTLINQSVSAPEEQSAGLLSLCFWGNKTHLGSLRRNDYRLRVSHIILLTSHERAYILRRDQLHLVAAFSHLLRRLMRAATGFHYDDRSRVFRHELAKALPLQLLTKHNLPCHQCSVDLENILCQIDSDHYVRRHDCRPSYSVT